MKNYSYSIHNDLISNFLFLASCVGNYEMEKMETPQYSASEKSYIIKNDKLVVLEESKEDKDVYPDLEKVYHILKMRFSNSKLYFEDNDKLILSRFFELNWRLLIKQELYKEIQKQNDLSLVKIRVIASLQELQYRLGLNFTWDLNNSIENNWHLTRNKELYSNNEGDPLPLQVNKIEDDINWVESLTEDDIKFNFIELHPGIPEKELTKTIIRLLKEKKYFNKNYKEQYNLEIQKLNNYLFSIEEKTLDFDLSFIEKKQQLEFIKIYLYCKHGKIITTSKQKIISLFAGVFDRGRRSLEEITDVQIAKEIKADKGIAYFVNKDLIGKFTKRI